MGKTLEQTAVTMLEQTALFVTMLPIASSAYSAHSHSLHAHPSHSTSDEKQQPRLQEAFDTPEHHQREDSVCCDFSVTEVGCFSAHVRDVLPSASCTNDVLTFISDSSVCVLLTLHSFPLVSL